MQFKQIIPLLIMLSVISCNDELTLSYSSAFSQKEPPVMLVDKKQAKEKFASILSKAVYQHKSLRDFLKTEALEQFDENYDVLYALVRDKQIGKQTFREILVENSSEQEMRAIEEKLPLLNVLLPAIVFEDMDPSNFDTRIAEVPVAVAKDSTTSLYMNGKEVERVSSGQIPNFPVVVVNENTRVEAPAPAVRGISEKEVIFKSPNYDRKRNFSTRAAVSNESIGYKAINSFQYFNADDGSFSQMAYQRDYVYYGITPNHKEGKLNHSVRDYIISLEVNPKAFRTMSDFIDSQGKTPSDPYIKQSRVGKWGGSHSYDRLIDIMWHQGSFNFRFEVFRGNQSTPYVFYVPLSPKDLWDFNLVHYYKHGTWFRQSHRIWWIDIDKFTSKPVDLNRFSCSLPKWDIEEEGLSRRICIYEEDPSEEKEFMEEYEKETISDGIVKGEVKFNIGVFKVGASASSNKNTKREKITSKVTRKAGSDHLGTVDMNFYDPILIGRDGENYKLKVYQTGMLNFSITSK